MSDVKLFISRLLRGGFGVSSGLAGAFGLKELKLFEEIIHISRYTDKIKGFNILMFFAVTFFAVLNCRNVQEQEHKLSAFNAVITVVALVWCICSLSGVATFLYFNF